MPDSVIRCIRTPLMALLLFMSYRATNKIPLSINRFYEDLFEVLLNKHDGLKKGYKRQRTSGVNDLDFRKIFDAFCYYSKASGVGSYYRQDALELIQKAIDYNRVMASPDAYLSDLSRITCLLVEESNQYHFLHKSVQEYFCAAFIARLGNDKLAEFYNTQMNTGGLKWLQELLHLSRIDEARFNSMFAVPLIEDVLEMLQVPCNASKKIRPTKKLLRTFASLISVSVLSSEKVVDSYVFASSRTLAPRDSDAHINNKTYAVEVPARLVLASWVFEDDLMGKHMALYRIIRVAFCDAPHIFYCFGSPSQPNDSKHVSGEGINLSIAETYRRFNQHSTISQDLVFVIDTLRKHLIQAKLDDQNRRRAEMDIVFD